MLECIKLIIPSLQTREAKEYDLFSHLGHCLIKPQIRKRCSVLSPRLLICVHLVQGHFLSVNHGGNNQIEFVGGRAFASSALI